MPHGQAEGIIRIFSTHASEGGQIVRNFVWRMDLASELVFIGDEGVTEPKGASRRHGLEWSNSIAAADGQGVLRVWDTRTAQLQARLDARPDRDGRYRITAPDEATANTISIDGKPFAPMQNSYGLQARLGAAIYF